MKKIIICLTILFIAAAPLKGWCDEDPRIDEIVVSRSPSLAVSFQVKDAFTKEIEEAVKSGIPTSFTFIIELNRLNSIWFNDRIGKREFKHTVKYDTLKEEYEVTLEESQDKPVKTKDFNEMKKLMTTGVSVAITPEKPLLNGNGSEYEFRVMAELRASELPFLLNYMFFFVKIWDFKTGWYTYRFTP